MARISFTIPGRVDGKGRPRFDGRSRRTYTPAKTRASEEAVRKRAMAAMRKTRLLEGPVRLDIEMWRAYPESWSNKKRIETLYVTGRPDADNILKLIGDALNGIAWRDDAQVAELHFTRRYLMSGVEFVSVAIETLKEGAP